MHEANEQLCRRQGTFYLCLPLVRHNNVFVGHECIDIVQPKLPAHFSCKLPMKCQV